MTKVHLGTLPCEFEGGQEGGNSSNDYNLVRDRDRSQITEPIDMLLE